jgi:hypothetical protein
MQDVVTAWEGGSGEGDLRRRTFTHWGVVFQEMFKRLFPPPEGGRSAASSGEYRHKNSDD